MTTLCFINHDGQSIDTKLKEINLIFINEKLPDFNPLLFMILQNNIRIQIPILTNLLLKPLSYRQSCLSQLPYEHRQFRIIGKPYRLLALYPLPPPFLSSV